MNFFSITMKHFVKENNLGQALIEFKLIFPKRKKLWLHYIETV